MLLALALTSSLLGCWDEERLEVPWASRSIECHEECDGWSVERAEWLAGRKLWAVQIFAGSHDGAWKALAAAEGRSLPSVYWHQGHPGRATQGTVESNGGLFRTVIGVYATRADARRAAAKFPDAWVR